MNEPEIMRGNIKAKKKLLMASIVALLLFSLIRLFLQPRMAEWLMGLGRERALSILTKALAGALLLLIPIGLYMLNMARKTLRERRFPPSSAMVVKDVRIHRGARAIAIAITLIILALILITLSIVAAYCAVFMLYDVLLRP